MPAYTVKSGNTLSAIAAQNGIKISDMKILTKSGVFDLGKTNFGGFNVNQIDIGDRVMWSTPQNTQLSQNPLAAFEENKEQVENNNEAVEEYCTTCPKKDISIVFNPNGSSIDAEVDEYEDAEDLVLPQIPGSKAWSVNGIVDAYHRKYGDEEVSQLLVVFTPKGYGVGLGYTLQSASHWIDEYDVDHENRVIYIDDEEAFSNFTNDAACIALRHAVEDIATHIEHENETFWGAVWRITKGTGITVVGGVETFVGVVGVAAPEPTTTAAGAVLVTYGVSTMGEGVSMIFGSNDGQGYNFLEEGFAKVGTLIGGSTGEDLARTTFLVSNIIVSVGGSYKVLKVPNQSFFYKGTYTGKDFAKYWEEGYTIGRLQLAYRFASGGDEGMTLINVANNSNQWFLRLNNVTKTQLVTGTGLKVNARIIGQKNWHRMGSPSEIIRALVKLAIHANKLK